MNKKSLWILLLGLLSLIGTVIIFSRLPERIPVHWGLDGTVDRYGARANVFLTAGLPFLFYALMLLVPRIDPRRDSYRKHQKAFLLIIHTMVLFFIALHWVTIAIALGADIDIPTVICLAIAVIFAVIGNVLPQARPNYTFGIRTPWTLADGDVWRKTHRVGGFTFWAMAAAFAAAAFIQENLAFILSIGMVFAGVVFLFVYSYILYANKAKGGKNDAS